MFEADVQSVVDEYLGGLIREEDFLMDARPWANYESDYRSLIEFAKQEALPVLAANVPRRYVGAVGRQRGASIDDFQWPSSARPWLPPLPLPRPSAGYMAHLLNDLAVVRTDELGFSLDASGDAPSDAIASSSLEGGGSREGAGGASAAKKGAGCPYLGVRRQDGLLAPMLLWDARMAHAIATRLEQEPARLVLHVCGSFHCEGGLGIAEMLRHYAPAATQLVVAIYPEEDPQTFVPERHAGKGDFVILTDACLPRSHDYFRPLAAAES